MVCISFSAMLLLLSDKQEICDFHVKSLSYDLTRETNPNLKAAQRTLQPSHHGAGEPNETKHKITQGATAEVYNWKQPFSM